MLTARSGNMENSLNSALRNRMGRTKHLLFLLLFGDAPSLLPSLLLSSLYAFILCASSVTSPVNARLKKDLSFQSPQYLYSEPRDGPVDLGLISRVYKEWGNSCVV